MDEPLDELDDLLSDLCDGTITDEAFARLETRLVSDSDARRRYVQTMQLHADLVWSDGALSLVASPQQAQAAPAIATSGSAMVGDAQPLLIDAVAKDLSVETPLVGNRSGNPSAVIRRIGIGVAAAMLLLVPALLFFINWRDLSDQGDVAAIIFSTDARFTDGQPTSGGLPVGRMVRIESGSADLTFRKGSQVKITGQSALRIESNNRATLLSGTLSANVPPQAIGFTIDTPRFRVVDLGTRFSITAPPQGDGEVHVLEGSVEVHPKLRLPRLFLSFDGEDQHTDPFSGTRAHALGNALRVPGIIGGGAMKFDNSHDAKISLGNGGSKNVSEGTFGVSRGITIEVLIIPRWNVSGWSTRSPSNPDPKPYDYDQIFRKEDGEHRILLSFQDDDGSKQPIIPVVDPGPCLTFGLNLEGIGYHEFDMPLDGQFGRPTVAQIKDGKPHHIVATYDAATGMKAIYVDGTLRFRHRFPAGSRIVAGGGAPAMVGNSAEHANEGFSGVIDEFAFYDHALTPAEVAGHWRNVQAGRNYFGAQRFIRNTDGTSAAVVPLKAGEALRFDHDSGLPAEAVAVDSSLFQP